jgi:4-amino-4-deoxy-L-arabinose transferase-like glycosyltransferase
MKLYLLSATVLFFLFLVFFARRLPAQNPWFAAWLAGGVILQIYFAVLLAFDWRARALPPQLELILDIAGWLLIGAALLHSTRSSTAANDVILSGLAALVLLEVVALGLVYIHQAQGLRSLISNLAGIVPTAYMLIRFSGARLDRLPVWTAEILRSAQNDRIRAALGHARALLG